MALLEVRNLRTHFYTPDGLVRAVDGVDMVIEKGKTVGIVGESGSGKSVLNLTVLGLVPSPPAIVRADKILFDGQDLRGLPAEELRRLRGNRMAMIFQDPMTSLNPFLTIGDQIAEPLRIHKRFSARQANQRVLELLTEVGIPDPARCAATYPHEFSGGMRQRAMVAMAIACEPALLIADEPTTALDVTIQAQILELMARIRERHGTTIVLITHDLGVAAGFCDEIHVMYAGKVVERGPTAEIFANPRHPYTRALMQSCPRLDDDSRGLFPCIRGVPPDLTRLPTGCSFHPRCDHVIDRCRQEAPRLERGPSGGNEKACFVELEAPQSIVTSSRGGKEA
ncbi:MAG: ABC transporter ATP-binding protein [Planctomycetota bacterium]